MGELIGGEWRRTGIDTTLSNGKLQRKPSIFRDWITADGKSADGQRGFKAEADRYHLYVSLACPWAHRTLIMQIRPTIDMAHIKGHYYGSHPWLNPSGIVPIGPMLDFDAPASRLPMEER